MKSLKLVLVFATLIFTSALRAQPTSRPAGPGRERGEMLLQRIHQTLSELNLSDEQKTKINDILASAKEDMQKMVGELRDIGQEERAQRLREFLMGLRDKIQNELTDAQKQMFQEKIRQLRGAGPAGRGEPATRPGANQGPGERPMAM